MTEKEKSLAVYRFMEAKETLVSSRLCFDNKLYKDSINRSYYVVFYAIKSILALDSVDFKRHKVAVGYFNQHYVATLDEAHEQINTAEYVLSQVEMYLSGKGVID